MSAPTLVDPLAMPTMVSRLPKFGSRPKSAATPVGGAQTGPAAAAGNPASAGARLTNGFYHHPGPAPAAGVKGGLTAPPSSVKQNGFIRVPSSFSMKWRKGNGGTEEGVADGERESRGGKGGNAGQSRTGSPLHQCYLPRQQASPQRSPLPTQREVKKPTASSTGKGRGYGQAVTSSPSSSPSPQSSPRTLPVSKTGPHGTKLSQTASGLTNGTKQNLNGVAGSRQRTGAGGSLRVPQSSSRPGGMGGSRPGSGPGSRSGSPLLSNPPASRSHSSDSLGSGASARLTEGDRLRSRSLTQVRRLPSPTLTPPSSSSSLPRSPTVTRSYSFNRPGERGFKEPASSSAQAPPRGPPAKSPLARQASGGGAVGGDGGYGGVRVQSSAALGRSGVGILCLLPPSALKKPLLPSLGSASKPSGISYKLSRPSLIKQPRPLRVTSANASGSDPEVNQGLTGRRNSVETPSTTENSPGSTPEAPETGGLSAEPVSQGEVSIIGETLEDMSLSSTSSLERNDTSQEYMDDFDNLGNGGVGILLLSCNNDPDVSGLDQSCARFDDNKVPVNGVAKATGLCSFLEDSMDWAGVRLSDGFPGERGENRLTRLSRRRKSSQPDYQDQGGSSLDLSPSDSCGSGGTYMWDEEGLEPLGGAATSASINTNNNSTSHRIGSYDSDLNSIDILNNLDSCDLEDDDLMLDADFAEDASLHSDGDGMSHMAQWRRRQLCWGTQDVHNDNSDFQCYRLAEDPGNKRSDPITDKPLIFSLSPARSPCLSPGPGLGLDVEELAEDCSAVKSQLEYLQRLLLQEEDTDEDTLTLSPEASHSSEQHTLHTQVQDLLQEVQQLREELRSRDRTIAQLTQQLSVPMAASRCRCQETEAEGRTDRHTQTSVMERESVTHEASQTPWREHTPQILHSSSQGDQEPLTDPDPDPDPCLDHSTDPVPVPAPSPANPRSDEPSSPTSSPGRLPDRPGAAAAAPTPRLPKTEGGAEEEKRGGETKERRAGRSLQLPQPSRLRPLQFPGSRPAPAPGPAPPQAAALSLGSPVPAGPPPTSRALRQPAAPRDPETGAAAGGKVKALPLGCGSSSRLPKPKSH